jgi:nucleoid-associated protein YgaU
MSGELKKMAIEAYSKADYSGSPRVKFEVQVNPENYSVSYGVNYANPAPGNQPAGSVATQLEYASSTPQNMSFQFLFDTSGVLKDAASPIALPIPGEVEDLAKAIDDFMAVVIDYQSADHQPSYLILKWGTLLFKCRLVTMTINYKLFKPDGTPIRAVANCSFRGTIEENLQLAIKNNQSPDLTHIRTVKDGDTLPLMAFRIYGDANLYLEVAKVNKLKNFRQLETGQELFFPPIQKGVK